jgi:hypothetical protein
MSRFRFPIVLVGALIVCASVFAPVAGASFSVTEFSNPASNEDGSTDLQAGSHPFALTTTIGFPTRTNSKGTAEVEGHVKDVVVKLPPGLVGNTLAVPQCREQELEETKEDASVYGGNSGACSDATQVGTIVIESLKAVHGVHEYEYGPVPLYNMVPPQGTAAELGFDAGAPYHIFFSVRTGEDYGVTATSPDISQGLPISALVVTVWGVPASPAYDAVRGSKLEGSCGRRSGTYGDCPVSIPPTPYLTLPTQCETPLTSTIEADAWEEAGEWKTSRPYVSQNAAGEPAALTGCGKLDFSPSFSVLPDTQESSTPAGLTVDLRMPQFNESKAQVAEANLRRTVVRLPTGVSLSPSAADGLAACPLEGSDGINLKSDSSPGCPDASKIGTVQVETPLLKDRLEGSVYLAEQEHNPFGSMFALYLVFEDPFSGVIVKVAGQVTANASTGQLTAVFNETPQLPFEDLKLHFFGGPRSPLTTPVACGTYTTETEMESWAGQTVTPSSSFTIDSGPGGGPCVPSPGTWVPSFNAGTTSIQAGGFSPFTLTFSRNDTDQQLGEIALKMPQGLLGVLSGIPLCGEPHASQGTCGAGSLIGHVTVSAGLGNDPLTVEGGEVFLTGPYKGAPYGLSVVVPAKAGPYNLGTVIVRSKIEVDPLTAQLTVTSDPLPTMLDGIPLQLKHINVLVDRHGFTFNPTNCDPMSIGATLTSGNGSTASLSAPFQVTNCASLAFKPVFTASTQGKTSKADGASLKVKVEPPAEHPQDSSNGSSGSKPEEVNIKSVKVELPKQLPSRLTTLQKACTAQQFDSNPAGCPSASMVGMAMARTPILNNPLTGPAIFVSHGGEAFPQLIIVLQGENGLVVDLVGNTFISKAGITSSTFASVPDVPVSSFELTLPQGPYSALAANASLCAASTTKTVTVKKQETKLVHGKRKKVTVKVKRTVSTPQSLVIPTTLTGQNGAVITQNTKIAITGCSKVVKAQAKEKGKQAKMARKSTKHQLKGYK